jgi:hypothetical protein
MPTTIVSLTKGVRLRTVLRQFTASTAQQRNGCLVAYSASPLFSSGCIASLRAVHLPFVYRFDRRFD